MTWGPPPSGGDANLMAISKLPIVSVLVGFMDCGKRLGSDARRIVHLEQGHPSLSAELAGLSTGLEPFAGADQGHESGRLGDISERAKVVAHISGCDCLF